MYSFQKVECMQLEPASTSTTLHIPWHRPQKHEVGDKLTCTFYRSGTSNDVWPPLFMHACSLFTFMEPRQDSLDSWLVRVGDSLVWMNWALETRVDNFSIYFRSRSLHQLAMPLLSRTVSDAHLSKRFVSTRLRADFNGNSRPVILASTSLCTDSRKIPGLTWKQWTKLFLTLPHR